jgi:hypothetical protein
MAIGTSGYIEAVHLQQAPLKPDSSLKAAKMFQAVGNLVGASANLYDELNAPTNEQLVDLRQQFDAGLAQIKASNPNDLDYLSKAVANYEDAFNQDLNKLGISYVEALQGHIYNETKNIYAAPQTLQEKLAIQENNLQIQQQIADIKDGIVSSGKPLNEQAQMMSESMTALKSRLSPKDRVKFGDVLQENIIEASAAVTNARARSDKKIQLQKTKFGYFSKINQQLVNINKDTNSTSQKASLFKEFSNGILQEIEKNVPLEYQADVYDSVSKEVQRLSTAFNSAAAKEQQEAERGLAVGAAAIDFSNGKMTLDQVRDLSKNRADKREFLGDFYTAVENNSKQRLSLASDTKNVGVYKAQKAIVDKRMQELRDHLYFGQNNNADDKNQFIVFEGKMRAFDTAIAENLASKLNQEAYTHINNGDVKKASDIAKQLNNFNQGTKANAILSKIASTTKLARELITLQENNVFNADVPSNGYENASKEAKQRITDIMSAQTKAYIDSMAAAQNPEVRKDVRDAFTEFLSNKQSEIKGVREKFSSLVDSAKSSTDIAPYSNLINELGNHSASLLLGKDQVKEINKLDVLLKYLPNLREGEELNDVRDRIMQAEGNTLQGELLDDYQEAVSISRDIPVVEDRQGYVDTVQILFKTTDVNTAKKAAKELFDKAKGNYLEVENSLVIGTPNVVLQKPEYYKASLEAAVDGINASFPEGTGTATADELSETHNIQQLPSGDVAIVPKTGAGTSTQTVVLSREEVVKRLVENYDGSTEAYTALRDATKTTNPDLADVTRAAWKEANKTKLSEATENFVDNVAESKAAQAIEWAANEVGKLGPATKEAYETITERQEKYGDSLWKFISEDIMTNFEGAVTPMIEGLDNLLFGEDTEEEQQ